MEMQQSERGTLASMRMSLFLPSLIVVAGLLPLHLPRHEILLGHVVIHPMRGVFPESETKVCVLQPDHSCTT